MAASCTLAHSPLLAERMQLCSALALSLILFIITTIILVSQRLLFRAEHLPQMNWLRTGAPEMSDRTKWLTIAQVP